ncbi:MAG: hypothetical protein HYY95_22255 [Candidatus Rokubacteria bacterium]|nr:hypothetical protein [Candidatus Rokubacteria bacterium]MBI3108263.1 hypothetical protein [Candidatus Rokubacteria bacterium]
MTVPSRRTRTAATGAAGTARREVINTGVILSPSARVEPMSLDRFITEVLDQEFRP